MLSVKIRPFILSVVRLNVVMLSVVAPEITAFINGPDYKTFC